VPEPSAGAAERCDGTFIGIVLHRTAGRPFPTFPSLGRSLFFGLRELHSAAGFPHDARVWSGDLPAIVLFAAICRAKHATGAGEHKALC
jgi:hypothetical protein